MSNYIDISLLVPAAFVRYKYSSLPQYNTLRMFDDWAYNLIRKGKIKRRYFQKWQTNDIFYFQCESDYSPIRLSVVNPQGVQINEYICTVVATSTINPSRSFYEAQIAWNSYAEGTYYILVYAGSNPIPIFITEGLCVKTLHPGTMLFTYTNERNRMGIIQTPTFTPSFRVESELFDYDPQSDDTVYINQSRSHKVLSSYGSEQYSLFIGDQYGVPDWVPRKMRDIFGCSKVLIDGTEYAKPDGAKWEPKRAGDYALAGWQTKVVQSKNSGSIRYTDDTNVAQDDIIITHNINTAGFGDLDGPASDNIVQITELN